MKNLHILSRFSDRWSYLYLERGILDLEASSLILHQAECDTPIPIDQLSVVMLGPGISVSHKAVQTLADNNCLLAWVGENGIRLYAHSTGGTFSSRRLIHQAKLASDESLRLQVAYRMYQKRFDESLTDKTIEQVRGLEGIRVRRAYAKAAQEYGIPWEGRNYHQGDWFKANAANRALSAANACLYGVCHAAIVSAGYSAGLGFIHIGKMLSFVYDIADLYKTEITVPLAFRLASSVTEQLERKVRQSCRQAFYEAKLMQRLLPDLAEVLDARDDLEETPQEMAGTIFTLDGRSGPGDLPGESERSHTG